MTFLPLVSNWPTLEHFDRPADVAKLAAEQKSWINAVGLTDLQSIDTAEPGLSEARSMSAKPNSMSSMNPISVLARPSSIPSENLSVSAHPTGQLASCRTLIYYLMHTGRSPTHEPVRPARILLLSACDDYFLYANANTRHIMQ